MKEERRKNVTNKAPLKMIDGAKLIGVGAFLIASAGDDVVLVMSFD